MKALVVGGTKGFGLEVVEKLKARGYEVITTGRSGGDFSIDVGDEKEWALALAKIQKEHEVLDMAVFVAGFARASDPEKRTEKEWEEHKQKNVGHVEATLRTLRFSPKAKIVTIGSQWSFRKGSKELEPYIEAKHQLKELTERFADEHPEYSVVHIAVPPMRTPQRELVWEQFGERPEQKKGQIEIAEPAIIAKSLVHEAIEKEHHGESIQIDTNGERSVVIERQRAKENLWPKR